MSDWNEYDASDDVLSAQDKLDLKDDLTTSVAPKFKSVAASRAHLDADLTVSKGLEKMAVSSGSAAEEAARWELDPESVEIGDELGKGAFGEVYRGKLFGKQVAVKKLLNQNLDPETLNSLKQEVAIMSKLRHPNVLLFMGACTQPGNLMIVTELMPRGSVHDLLHDKNNELSFKQRMKMAKQAALGMNWLHCSKPPFIHRDLKTNNLLVDENYNVKVCDFGLAHIKAHGDKGVRGSYGSIGTPLWMAPEVLLNKPYDESADVYSFGIVLWELLTMENPFPDVDTFSMMLDQVVNQQIRPPIPDTCPTMLKEIIEACWSSDATKRPSFQKILPLFDEIIVDHIIRDKNGRLFWKKYFMDKDNLQENVTWKDFVVAFTSYWEEKIPRNPDDIRWKCLYALIADNPKQIVTIEAFGRLLEWFGPMEGLESFLDAIVNLLKKSWFHGDMSSEAAEKLLAKHKKGTFLVRFSAREPGSYAITTVSQSQKIKHFRVYHKPGLQYLIGKTECESLEDIIAKYHKDLYLKASAPGSPFEDIFKAPKKQQSVSCGYIVPAL